MKKRHLFLLAVLAVSAASCGTQEQQAHTEEGVRAGDQVHKNFVPASNPAILVADNKQASTAKDKSKDADVAGSNLVGRVQDELNKRGVKAPRNGVLGEETRLAIKNFQKGQGLEPTGKLTETTLNALGIPLTRDYREPASVLE